MKIKVFNETEQKIPTSIIKRIEKVFSNPASFDHSITRSISSLINLIIQSPASITKLNKELFNRNTPTDVISINQPVPHTQHPIPNSSGSLLGDIYICPTVIKQNAKKYKVDYNEEFARVVIHGILHLLGFDHKKAYGESDEEMFEVQERLLDKINITE